MLNTNGCHEFLEIAAQQSVNERVAANTQTSAIFANLFAPKYWGVTVQQQSFRVGPSTLFVVFVTCLARPGAPVNEARLEAGEGENGGDASAIGMHLEEPEKTVILNSKDDPTPIRRVGTGECFDVSTLVVR